jgi:hypothetical protein
VYALFLHFDFSPKLDRHYWTSIRTHMLHSIHNINPCPLLVLVLVLDLFPCWPLFLQPLLEPATVDAVRSLLPDYADGSLASLCTWADDIRWQYKWHWTSALHFIDTPDFLCRYNYDRKLITFFVCACLQRLWSFILLVSWIGNGPLLPSRALPSSSHRPPKRSVEVYFSFSLVLSKNLLRPNKVSKYLASCSQVIVTIATVM